MAMHQSANTHAAGLHNRLGLITNVSLQEQYCDSVTLLCIFVYLHKVPCTVLNAIPNQQQQKNEK
jgi:hypothetical protein